VLVDVTVAVPQPMPALAARPLAAANARSVLHDAPAERP
jgi:hypothetical protein